MSVKKIAVNGKNLHCLYFMIAIESNLRNASEENCRFCQIYSVSYSLSNLKKLPSELPSESLIELLMDHLASCLVRIVSNSNANCERTLFTADN